MKFATFFYFLVLAFVADAVTIDLSVYDNSEPLEPMRPQEPLEPLEPIRPQEPLGPPGPSVGVMIAEEPALHPPFEGEESDQFNFDAPLGHIEYNKPEYIPGYVPKPKYPVRRV
uniref:DUF4794 domain-containing protein n=1 Tax=Bactrocera dorsalis TaxID=27457 RepID=A0A034V190_BACDO